MLSKVSFHFRSALIRLAGATITIDAANEIVTSKKGPRELAAYRASSDRQHDAISLSLTMIPCSLESTEIGKKAWLFAKLQPGRARKRINAT